LFTCKTIPCIAAACLLLAPLPATAKEDLCNKLLPPEMALGDYTMTIDEGVFTSPKYGISIPMKGSVEPAEISMKNGALVLTSVQKFNVEFRVQPTDMNDWWGDDMLKSDQLGQVDFQLCPTRDALPRLLGEGNGSYVDAEDPSIVPHVKLNMLVYDVSDDGVFASGLMKGTLNAEGQTFVFTLPVEIAPR